MSDPLIIDESMNLGNTLTLWISRIIFSITSLIFTTWFLVYNKCIIGERKRLIDLKKAFQQSLSYLPRLIIAIVFFVLYILFLDVCFIIYFTFISELYQSEYLPLVNIITYPFVLGGALIVLILIFTISLIQIVIVFSDSTLTESLRVSIDFFSENKLFIVSVILLASILSTIIAGFSMFPVFVLTDSIALLSIFELTYSNLIQFILLSWGYNEFKKRIT